MKNKIWIAFALLIGLFIGYVGAYCSKCVSCDGTGRDWNKCYSCDGTGVQKCYSCNGQGGEYEQCILCDGQGEKCY